MPTKDPKNTTQTPSGGAPAGDGFFDKESIQPQVEPGPGLVRLGDVPEAGASAPDKKPDAPAAPPDDGKKTPEEWARELGHTDAPTSVSTDHEGTVARTKTLRRRPIREAKGYVFAAVKRHAGWGKQHPIDVRLSREEYEEAVDEAMGTPIGEKPGTKGRALKWRHDVVTARANAAKATAEAAKAGGER